MKTIIEINDQLTVTTDLARPIDISIPINQGAGNPNCYWAEEVKFNTIRSTDFVGSVKEGGSVNYQSVTLTPHGNGTHTECYGHVTKADVTINQQLKAYIFLSQLISVEPVKTGSADLVIQKEDVAKLLSDLPIKALILRTLPNNASKLTRQYSGTNPPYVSMELMQLLVEKGIQHLLVDLPSLDKEVDGGKLSAHRSFWGLPENIRENATITELIFVDNLINDGLYLLNLQIPSLNMDAAPSKPVIYPLQKIDLVQTR
jgi:kynurenine formamidase